jgi:hypothetical protein
VNFEIGVIVHTATDAQKMVAWAEKLSEHGRELKADPDKKIGFFRNIVEDLSRLLAPFM